MLTGGALFDRDQFHDLKVMPFHFIETTATIVVFFVFFCLYFFCLAVTFFAIWTFLHVLHILLLMCHCNSYSAFKLQVCLINSVQFSSVCLSVCLYNANAVYKKKCHFTRTWLQITSEKYTMTF